MVYLFNRRCGVSQEEHILHELKEMHGWIAHVNKQISGIRWSLLGIVAILVIIMAILLGK